MSEDTPIKAPLNCSEDLHALFGRLHHECRLDERTAVPDHYPCVAVCHLIDGSHDEYWLIGYVYFEDTPGEFRRYKPHCQ